MEVPIRIVGIAITEQEAALRPQPGITTDIQSLVSLTAGKIHVGIEVLQNRAPFALQLVFDGKQVEIKNNKKGMGSNTEKTEGRYESYSVDLPMRLVTVGEHTIEFIIGWYENKEFLAVTRSDVFTLSIPSETPVINPKVAPEDED